MTATCLSRRHFVATAIAGAGATALSRPMLAQGAQPRIVVIGGGFAGATAARFLKRADPRLEAMPDGGTVVMALPALPYRCPPASYERASLIAYYLKTRKPRSKLVVLDAKETFSMQRLFENAWKEFYPNLEWVPVSSGGNPTGVDAATMTVSSDFETYKAAVANVIPPQKAGRIAELAALPGRP